MVIIPTYGQQRQNYPRSLPGKTHPGFFSVAVWKINFSTIYLVRAFNQIPVAEEDIPNTAITTPFGLFEFMYMTFGIRNAAQTF